MTAPKFGVSVGITVARHLVPSLFVAKDGGVVAALRTSDGYGTMTIQAASLDEYRAWLVASLAAVEALQAPVLPLEDVLSTHPAEVTG